MQQVWEYGKDRGFELYSAVTSSVEYRKDKNSLLVYWASVGVTTGQNAPVLTEFRWGEKEPVVEMKLKNTTGYRALPIDLKKAFAR